MPPSAAPEWLRVGWSLETTATSAPASNASIAPRMPAQPAPTTSTSCLASTAEDATEWRSPCASSQNGRAGHHHDRVAVRIDNASPEQEVLLVEILAGLRGTRIDRLRLARYDEINADWDSEFREFGVEPSAE